MMKFTSENAQNIYRSERIVKDRELEDVYEFRDKMALPWKARGNIPARTENFRVYMTQQARRLFEECNEFLAGIDHGNLEEMADALVDLVYFAKGTAAMLGLPWEHLWDEVHEANMHKVPGVSKRLDVVNDVRKPEDWRPPNIGGILAKYGIAYNIIPEDL